MVIRPLMSKNPKKPLSKVLGILHYLLGYLDSSGPAPKNSPVVLRGYPRLFDSTNYPTRNKSAGSLDIVIEHGVFWRIALVSTVRGRMLRPLQTSY
jgi:hypothetical protein